MEQSKPRLNGQTSAQPSTLGRDDLVSIRVAAAADFAELHLCQQLAFDMPVLDQHAIEARRNSALAARLQEGGIRVADASAAILGYVSFYPGTDHLFVDAIAVLPQHQGAGLGSMLLQNAENAARREGLRSVRLFTDGTIAENMRFYSRRGYRETGRCEDGDFSRVYFSKPLAA